MFHYLAIPHITERMRYRDSLMAVNVAWLKTNFYNTKKIVLWAADRHIARSPATQKSPKWLGEWLSHWWGNAYYAIAVQKGSYEQYSFPAENFSLKYPSKSRTTFDAIIGIRELVKLPPTIYPCLLEP